MWQQTLKDICSIQQVLRPSLSPLSKENEWSVFNIVYKFAIFAFFWLLFLVSLSLLDVIIYNLVFMPRSSRGGLMFNGRPTVPFLWKWYIQNASRERLSDLAQTTSCIRLKGDIIRNLVHLRSLWPHTTKWHRCHGGQTDEVRTRCTQKVKGHLHCDQSVNQSINQSTFISRLGVQ